MYHGPRVAQVLYLYLYYRPEVSPPARSFRVDSAPCGHGGHYGGPGPVPARYKQDPKMRGLDDFGRFTNSSSFRD